MSERGFRDVFVDLLDTAGTLAIRDRFAESSTETTEGPAEFANPATVSQPVNQSTTPGGQAIVPGNGFLNPVVLAIGGVTLLVLGVILARVLR